MAKRTASIRSKQKDAPENGTNQNGENMTQTAEVTQDENTVVSSFRQEMETAKARLDTEILRLETEREKIDLSLAELYELRGDNQKPARRMAAKREGVSGEDRIVWADKLKALPRTFTTDDMIADPQIAAKGKTQCFPAIDRWKKAGLVQPVKGERGKYRKV